MKRLLISIVMAVALLVIPVSGVFADSSAGVEVTATPLYLDIAITPITTEALGTLAENSTTWAYDAVPANPLGANSTFTTTNNSSVSVNISISATDFTGTGSTWTLVDTDPTDNLNQVRMMAGVLGTAWSSMVAVTNTPGDNPTFHSALSALSGTEKWEFSLETGTFDDSALKTSNITLTATAS